MNRFIPRAEEFSSIFGIAISDAEKRISEFRPNDGRYFNENGTRRGYLLPLCFSAVSLILKNATNILEVGTGLGNITNLLAKLFPTAMIYTIDIPAHDKDYEELAWRNSEKNTMRFKININRDNIKYIERNSFFLPSMGLPQEFDFIYVDGGHRYPVVAWDIMFAYNSLRPEGFAFFHDYGPDLNVTPTIEYIRDIIDEEIRLIYSNATSKHRDVAWLRRLVSERMK